MNTFQYYCSAILFAVSAIAQAAPFTYQYTDTVSVSSIAAVNANDAAVISVVLDNGGTSLNSQTWAEGDLQSVTFDFGGGGLTTTFNSPFDGGIQTFVGNFSTNAAGTLTDVVTIWTDSALADFTTTGPARLITWALGGSNAVYFQNTFDPGSVSLQNVPDMLIASNWSLVADRPASVPVPAAIWLFAGGLGGIRLFRKRHSVPA